MKPAILNFTAMKTTVNHEEIRTWIEKHGGRPAIIDDPQAGGNRVGLRVDFPGIGDENLLSQSRQSVETNWDKFFQIFESRNLAFTYREKEPIEDPTMSYEFVRRENVEEL